MGDDLGNVRALLWPFIDFNFTALAMVEGVFGCGKLYNIFGTPMSYWAVAFVVSLVLGLAAVLLTYLAQRKRLAA
jgi:hypothetical protein